MNCVKSSTIKKNLNNPQPKLSGINRYRFTNCENTNMNAVEFAKRILDFQEKCAEENNVSEGDVAVANAMVMTSIAAVCNVSKVDTKKSLVTVELHKDEWDGK